MIDLITASVGAGVGALCVGVGYLWGRGEASRRMATLLDDQRLDAERSLATRERDLERLRAELLRTRTDSATSLTTSRPVDVAPSRPTARALEAFVARLRGLASVGAAAVVDRDGLLATPCDDHGLSRAATLAADLTRLYDVELPGFVGLTVERRGADPITWRLLPRWTGGAWLVARGLGGPVNGLALDVAIAGAYREQRHAPPGLSLTGHSTGAAPGEAGLEREIGGAFKAVGVVGPDGLTAYAALDGPSRDTLAGMTPALMALYRRVVHWCGEPSALRLANPHGEWMHMCPLAGDRSLLTVGVGPTVDELALERLRGRLRRITTTIAGGVEPSARLEEHAS